MNIVKHYPAANLPDDLRGDIPKDALVQVSISDESVTTLPFSQIEIDALLEPALAQEEAGLGIVCADKDEGRAFFDDVKRRAMERLKKA